MGAIFGFLPKILGKGAAMVAQYSDKKPGETNVMGCLSLAALAYFNVDKADVVDILQGLIKLIG